MRRALLIALAGCGGHAAAVDAGISPDAIVPCTATFSGNFDESSTSSTCATVTTDAGDVTLELAVPSATLGTPVPITIDLGAAPVPGEYSSETVASWRARVGVTVALGACIYIAGTTAVPQGSFDLALTAIDPAAGVAHGKLDLTLYVLSSPATACGTEDTEALALAF